MNDNYYLKLLASFMRSQKMKLGWDNERYFYARRDLQRLVTLDSKSLTEAILIVFECSEDDIEHHKDVLVKSLVCNFNEVAKLKISQHLITRRHAKGYSQEDLAKRMGVLLGVINYYERQKAKTIKESRIRSFAEAFECEAYEFAFSPVDQINVDDNYKLAQFMKYQRHLNLLTQTDLSEVTGLSRGIITDLENANQQTVSISRLKKLCEGFNCDLSDYDLYDPELFHPYTKYQLAVFTITNRLQRQWSQSELASRSKVSYSKIKRIESASTEYPSVSSVKSICKIFDSSVCDIQSVFVFASYPYVATSIVSQFIQKKRVEENLSIADLERMSGISRTYLSDIEKGKPKKIGWFYIHKLCIAFDTTPEIVKMSASSSGRLPHAGL